MARYIIHIATAIYLVIVIICTVSVIQYYITYTKGTPIQVKLEKVDEHYRSRGASYHSIGFHHKGEYHSINVYNYPSEGLNEGDTICLKYSAKYKKYALCLNRESYYTFNFIAVGILWLMGIYGVYKFKLLSIKNW
ncbi:MAG: hypothetical protein M0D57_09865 [Sphingobacteriales bacterium JAD_PAG50586_3]|nr:MAG: hypothetical protein M0D57_09865 [Sphingobacteriales bacterium JAD_PAG50586_3]